MSAPHWNQPLSDFKLHPQLARDCIVVSDLNLSRLLLMNNSDYPWCILVPRRAGIREIHELKENDQIALLQESSELAVVMLKLFRGEKMNIAALGNIVPQLHLHHIVRKTSDKAWPKPVWGTAAGPEYASTQIQTLCAQLSAAFH